MFCFVLPLDHCVSFISNRYHFTETVNHCSLFFFFFFFPVYFLLFHNVLIDFHVHNMIALPASLLIPRAGHINLSSQLCLLAIASLPRLTQTLKSILVMFSSKILL